MSSAIRLAPPPNRLKARVAEACAVLSEITLQSVALRMGISASALYAFANPDRRQRPSPERALQLASICRAEAERLTRVAAELERAASSSAA